MGIISPYATGPGPIYYGSRSVNRKDFWTLGLIFGAIYLGTLLIIGVPFLLFYLGESRIVDPIAKERRGEGALLGAFALRPQNPRGFLLTHNRY